MGGYKLDKWIHITEITLTSFEWKCVKGKPSEGICFKTCDDCLDYLVFGTDENNFKAVFLGIPKIGDSGRITHSFRGAIHIGLAQVTSEEKAKEYWRNNWENLPVLPIQQTLTIRLESTDPHWLRLNDPDNVARELNNWWENNSKKGQQRATIDIRIPELRLLSAKIKIRWRAHGWYDIGLSKSKDGKTFERIFSRSAIGHIDEVYEIELDPECEYYRIHFADGDLDREIARVYKTVELILSFECEETCQTSCELCCEEACQITCQEKCELSCEEVCETFCQSTCELSCQSTCELSCQEACELSCQETCEASCQSTCELSCQEACEISCQSTCELSCQETCELTCQETCEETCEATCEKTCQTACEVTCQTACEKSCQTACELVCETTEETASRCCSTGSPDGGFPSIAGTFEGKLKPKLACKVKNLKTIPAPGASASVSSYLIKKDSEEVDTIFKDEEYIIEVELTGYPRFFHDKSSIETECGTITYISFIDANDKEQKNWIPTLIIEGCKETCEIACQTTCELTCQETCELSCQEKCEFICQETCELSCQETCELSCQETCELTCQETCELSCQSTCELSCQETCELSCQETCELSCQETCELACEKACEEACQKACELSCQETCELACQEACETETQVCPLTILFIGTPLICYIQPLRKIKPLLPAFMVKAYYSRFLVTLAKGLRWLSSRLLPF